MSLIAQMYLGLSLILIALILAIFVLIMIYFRLLKKYNELEKQKIEKEEVLVKETEEILKRAEAEYAQKIQEAGEKSRTIIKKATDEKNRTEKSLLDALEELDKEQKKIIYQGAKNLLSEHKINNLPPINLQSSVSKDILKHLETTVGKYKEAVGEETEREQEIVAKRFNSEYKALEEELNNYGKMRREKLDQEIVGLVREVSKLTLKKSITLKGHEKLVLEALEEIKKKGTL